MVSALGVPPLPELALQQRTLWKNLWKFGIRYLYEVTDASPKSPRGSRQARPKFISLPLPMPRGQRAVLFRAAWRWKPTPAVVENIVEGGDTDFDSWASATSRRVTALVGGVAKRLRGEWTHMALFLSALNVITAMTHAPSGNLRSPPGGMGRHEALHRTGHTGHRANAGD